MNSAEYVDNLIATLKNQGVPLSDVAWEASKACVGWPYVFGARGGKVTKDGVVVRQFDCRGFTYWILLAVYGWKLIGAGCTSQWNDENNWKAKGKISDGMPGDTLVCLFYSKDGKEKTWEHTGFGYRGQTVECSKGVQYFKTMNKKWTHWAIPKCVDGDITPVPLPDRKPTLRKGSSGEYVSLLQTMLILRGYVLPEYGADGKFGNETLDAVKEFQKDHGLAVDGVVGEKTWQALEKVEPAKKYTVTIPGLNYAKAEALCSQYAGATMVEERG